MRKMKILLSRGSSAENYLNALEGVGAEGVAKYLPEVDTNYDGLILCGGGDIDPKYYGEEINGSKGIDAERDSAEFALLKAFVEKGLPVLGICRGCQLFNILLGGIFCVTPVLLWFCREEGFIFFELEILHLDSGLKYSRLNPCNALVIRHLYDSCNLVNIKNLNSFAHLKILWQFTIGFTRFIAVFKCLIKSIRVLFQLITAFLHLIIDIFGTFIEIMALSVSSSQPFLGGSTNTVSIFSPS